MAHFSNLLLSSWPRLSRWRTSTGRRGGGASSDALCRAHHPRSCRASAGSRGTGPGRVPAWTPRRQGVLAAAPHGRRPAGSLQKVRKAEWTAAADPATSTRPSRTRVGVAPRRAALSHTRPGPSYDREHRGGSCKRQAASHFQWRRWITGSVLGGRARKPDSTTVGEPSSDNTVARPFLVVSLLGPVAFGARSHTERLLAGPATGCPWRLTHSAGRGAHRGRIDMEALDTQVEMSSLLWVRGVQREVS